MVSKLGYVVRDWKSRRYGLIFALIYFLLYLYRIGNLTIVEMPGFLKFRVLENWQANIFKPIAPYLWESVAVLYIAGGLSWFISVPNLLLDVVLSALVFVNITSAMYSYYVLPIRPGLRGLIGLVPSLFTGFVCCVPTFIITLGAISTSFTVFFIELRPFLMPLSILIMGANLAWSLRSLKGGLIEIYEKEKAEGSE